MTWTGVHSKVFNMSDDDFDLSDLQMVTQYVQNQQEVINELIEKNMQLTTEVVVEDAVLDSNHSLVIAQANNRTFAAQLVLKKILEGMDCQTT